MSRHESSINGRIHPLLLFSLLQLNIQWWGQVSQMEEPRCCIISRAMRNTRVCMWVLHADVIFKHTLSAPSAAMQRTDGVSTSFLLAHHLRWPLHLFSTFTPFIACVCMGVWKLELISWPNSNYIPLLQMKLFSPSLHLFSPSFVLHPAADSVSPQPKTCSRKSPWPKQR